jgi:hypothetical protein
MDPAYILKIDISTKNKIILKNIDDNFKKPYLINEIQFNEKYEKCSIFDIACEIKEIILNLKYNISYCFSNNHIREFIILSSAMYRFEKILYEYKIIYFGYVKYSLLFQSYNKKLLNSMNENIKNMLNDNKIKILYKNEYLEEINELIKSSNDLIDYFISNVNMNIFKNYELLYYIIKYKQQEVKISKFKEELMANVWHPRNFEKFKYLDPETFGDEE